MNEPRIIIEDNSGINNNSLETQIKRLDRAQSYRDLSTVCIVPTRGMVHARVVQCWLALMTPMNQKFARIFAVGLEIGMAYNSMIESILSHEKLRDFKYILTMEEDNLPPMDGLFKLYESIESYDVVGGLYWTKGEHGQPMIYGAPESDGFIPQAPIPNAVQEARGLGMGFNLFKMDIFKDERLKKPWFLTQQENIPGVGHKSFTQDLYFYDKAGSLGYRFACDTRVRVGHLDVETGVIW